ncbi:MAG: 50S ribosomal protein L31 [Candidatus Doudnabacteria bacterium]|nr:50S ribosomal protein L31 [Candidatus Doudnabacteria bacterium]
MKPNIHPQFYTSAVVTCACGNSFTTGSTVEKLHTEVCSQCHPFYTGKQKLLDTMGRVDKFKRSITAATSIKATIKPKKERKARAKK